ncbi:lysophospholipid acyltransferase family protein [Parendozoicomonas haliclonae]|uniref:lysophospholipid acyltransferase family protein n=1 Tax=Parendozoicomonas haliclonae TaxID=1960125 RepID=UPI0013FDECB4|nr:lysophospholipid acyltransferase family protein [Parendozoicomonas haliclonae]
MPVRSRHPFFIKNFCVVSLFLCRWICGIRWKVEGLENVPDKACVVASNHQSPWETFFVQMLISPQSTVIKKELFSVPFFGWAFKRLNPIAIDRKERRSAMQQVMDKGKVCLDDDYGVVIFPEGTRHHWPEVGRFTRGAATLAQHANVPVLPIAHDAGRFWPTFTLKKTPGEITVRIGPVIDSQNKPIDQLTSEVRDWVVANHP